MIKALRARLGAGDDDGVAMLMVLTVMFVVTALGSTAVVLATNNLNGANLDRQAGATQNLSEAGIAQAISWIRYNGVGSLACSPSCAPASGQTDWGQGPNAGGAGPNTTIAANAPYGHLVTSGTSQYRVWIEKTAAFLPPTNSVGRYTIHATAISKSGVTSPVSRSVSQDVRVTPFKFPIGIFAHTVAAGGTGGIHYESLFTDSCIQGRAFETFQGVDAYYGVPAAAHSAAAIVPQQNDACTQANSIHNVDGKGKSPDTPLPCNSSYPNDTDAYGDTLTSPPCKGNGILNGSPWLTTSKETSFANMASTYGFDPLGLSNSQLDALRTAAQQQGFYFTDTTAIPAQLQTSNAGVTYPHPVLFYDLKGSSVGGIVDLKDLKGYSRSYPVDSTSASCSAAGAVVVVLNGNVRLNANTVLTASVFAPSPAPYGQVLKANGGGQLIGTLYADSIDMRGTADIYLDSCFLANLPGGLISVTVDNYRESDR